MKYKLEKCMHIVNDLVMYCATLGATDYHVDYHPNEADCSFVLHASIRELDEEIVCELAKALNQHRTKEVEEAYWAITYDSDSPCENVMIGMMLDEADTAYNGEILTIRGTRRD